MESRPPPSDRLANYAGRAWWLPLRMMYAGRWIGFKFYQFSSAARKIRKNTTPAICFSSF